MIDCKETYIRYREQDRIALGRKQDRHPRLFADEIWKFEILLRKVEYYTNCKRDFVSQIINKYYKLYKEIEEIENELDVNLDEI